MTQRIVLATRNRGKVDELRRILADLDVELVPADELDLEDVEETGDTFEANALLKARAAVEETGLPAMADDSGLVVDPLDGDPGVRSARYAGEHGDDEANNDRLLHELEDVPESERTARFVCAAALVAPDGREWIRHGTMEGRIIRERRGDGGFGYDPLFVGEGETRTNAELPAAVKDARSHRGAAFRAMHDVVEQLLGPVDP